jgi:hypothetical protein
LALFCAGSLGCLAQITIDWAAKDNPLVSYPKIVSGPTNATIAVVNVNDLLYKYEINLKATPRALDDAGKWLVSGEGVPTIRGERAAEVKDCATAGKCLKAAVNELGTKINNLFDCEQQTEDNKPKSVPVGDTIAGWNQTVKPLVEKLQSVDPKQAGSIASVLHFCTNADPESQTAIEARDALARVGQYQRRIDGPHEVSKNVSLDPDTDYEVKVVEKCRDKETASVTVKFSPSSNVLTLSLGALLTSLTQRTYSSVKDPANTEQNVLSVNGAGWRTPLGVVLLNYQIPKAEWLGGSVGLSLSSGLVVPLGTTDSKVSGLGWFGGPSLHLYHRLFITLGLHVGEFADFPYGLQKGSVVPANYGDLNPVKRATGRFAFAVTYQTAGFGQKGAKPTVSSGTQSAQTGGADNTKTSKQQ